MTGLSRKVRVLAIVGAALAVLLAGGIYAAVRPTTWKSESSLVLHLGKVRPESISSLLDSFSRSGIVGTFVEQLSAPQTLRNAGSPAITVDARAVPDTRVIAVSATGPEDAVQPGLAAVVRAAQLQQNLLKDPFRLGVLSPPGAPTKAGPSTQLLLLATVLLAALAALFVFVITRRAAPAAQAGTLGGRPDLRPAPAPPPKRAAGKR